MKRDRKLLTEAINGAIDDFPREKLHELLEGWSRSDLIEYCIEKYESEYSLNVGSLGSFGADEVAWVEVIGVFQI